MRSKRKGDSGTVNVPRVCVWDLVGKSGEGWMGSGKARGKKGLQTIQGNNPIMKHVERIKKGNDHRKEGKIKANPVR